MPPGVFRIIVRDGWAQLVFSKGEDGGPGRLFMDSDFKKPLDEQTTKELLTSDTNTIIDLFRSIELANFVVPLYMDVILQPAIGKIEMNMYVEVLDRVTGEKTKLLAGNTYYYSDMLASSNGVLLPYDRALRRFANIIRCEIWKLMQHEVDETFLVNGERIYDPHLNE